MLGMGESGQESPSQRPSTGSSCHPLPIPPENLPGTEWPCQPPVHPQTYSAPPTPPHPTPSTHPPTRPLDDRSGLRRFDRRTTRPCQTWRWVFSKNWASSLNFLPGISHSLSRRSIPDGHGCVLRDVWVGQFCRMCSGSQIGIPVSFPSLAKIRGNPTHVRKYLWLGSVVLSQLAFLG